MKSVRVSSRITKKESVSFKRYLNDIAMIPQWTLEEEIECCLRMAGGDSTAKNELITKNLRFVVSIAKNYETPTLNLEDLVNEGNIGLVLAADRYVLNRGFKFITYAVFWIRKVIYEYISNTSKLVRIPCNKVASVSKFNNKISELEQRYGRSADITEVLEELQDVIPVKELKNFERFLNLRVDSLDNSYVHGDSEVSLYDMLEDDSMQTPDYNLDQTDIRTELNEMLNVLKPRDRQIMINLYGLNGTQPMTLEQISDDVGLTREMIRQVRVKSLEKLKLEINKIV